MQRIPYVFMILLAGVILTGCGPKRPVFYPNAHLDEVGMQVAQADIDDCIMKAEAAGANAADAGTAAGNVAKSGAIGAAAGAVFGAIMGNSVGRAAAATGGAAAAGSAVNEGFKSGDPATIHKNFVNRCLREKGYDVIGWK